ncbi:tyrosine-protein phosphatase [Paenibacillus illinoisensis]|uniref:tyrosine-protein phosphatase n=1 Tax=Paenibacillus illinoisensis TaxID=59845 RepID=UPI001C8D65FB|nr:tyrosine-protein phosphatase [Paenibacillus illinoisensis]MBY0215900.1 tyrosine-protein phosphatase [Paenibacillus illinoisensis]
MKNNNLDPVSLSHFDGLYNFRDFGGYATTDGKRVRKGILFRSDELSKLSKGDIARFDQLGLQLICDLRSETEQKSNKSRMLNKGTPIANLTLQDQSQAFTRLEFMKYLIFYGDGLDFEKTMKDMYRHMGTSAQSTLKELFGLLAKEGNLPVLIHCTGGKDRTGFLAAIIQLLLNVPYENVMKDYLYSNVRIGSRMKKAEKMIRLMSLYRVPSERIKPMLEVRRDYLEDVLQDILGRHENIEHYLKQECEIPESHIVRFKAFALENA